MEKLKIAVIGTAHPHISMLYKSFDKYRDRVEFIGCADVPPFDGSCLNGVTERMKHNLSDYGKLAVYENYKDLIDKRPDIALVGVDNFSHADIACELLANGIFTVVEKPMAMDFEGGIKMYRASERYGAPLAVNWPVTWFAAYRHVKELVDGGAVGRPLRFQYRSPATLGPFSYGGTYTNDFLASSWWYKHGRGGGSMLDYACYGCMLSTWILSKTAVSASAFRVNMMTQFADVEDYSSVALCFDGAVAQFDGSWSTINSGGIPTGPIIFGTEGTLVADRYSNQIKLYKKLRGKEPDEIFEAPSLNDDLGSEIIGYLHDKKPLHETLTPIFNLKALAALDAAIRSSESGKSETVYSPFRFV